MDGLEEIVFARKALTGSAVHTIDAKGRIIVPVKFREALGSTVFALKSADGRCIRIYPEIQFLRMLEKLCHSDVRMTALRRKISGSAEQLRVDTQGRMLVPEEMRLSVGITEKVHLVGMIEWLELWEEQSLETAEEELSDEEALRMMADLGIA